MFNICPFEIFALCHGFFNHWPLLQAFEGGLRLPATDSACLLVTSLLQSQHFDFRKHNELACQRRGCPQRHRTRFLCSFSDFDELAGERTFGDPGVVQLKRCAGCQQANCCLVACQRQEWRDCHRTDCLSFGQIPSPNVHIETSTSVSNLKMILRHIFQTCVAGGQECSWGPEGVDKAKQVVCRLHHWRAGSVRDCL